MCRVFEAVRVRLTASDNTAHKQIQKATLEFESRYVTAGPVLLLV